MSRLADTFSRIKAEGQGPGLVTYVTAGDPDLHRTGGILRALDRSGADVLEVGVPFSDPLADGPVIQRATERALVSGTTLQGVLGLIGGLRGELRAPIVIFSYANPILRLGAERFADQAREAGVDGVLVLDLPIEEADEFRSLLASRGIDTILLLSPTTTDERLRRAARLGSGFLYAISRLGVTGRVMPSRTGRRKWSVGFARPAPCLWHSGLAFRSRSTCAKWGDGLTRPWLAVPSSTSSPRPAPLTILNTRVEEYVRWLKS